MRGTRKILIITNTAAACDYAKLALVCFSLVFPRNFSPHKEQFFQYIVYLLMESVWQKHGLSCYLFGGNLGHLGHSGVFWQPEIYSSYCIISEFVVGFFFKICKSWESFNIPLFRNNPIITALFLSLPLLMFLVWAGVPLVYSSLPWVLTLLVEGTV